MSSATAYQATDTSGFVTLDTAQTISGNKTFSGTSTFSGPLLSSSVARFTDTSQPPSNVTGTYLGGYLSGIGITFVRSSAAGDEKIWDVITGPNTLNWRAVNDAYTAADSYLVIGRSGASITNTTLTKPRLGPTGSTILDSLRTEKSTMAAGTTGVIADTPVATTSVILVTPGFLPLGQLYVTISAGVGFTILSTNAADAGSVSWQRVTV
jgi:hypothetical protein